jgi:hypothetical protein
MVQSFLLSIARKLRTAQRPWTLRRYRRCRWRSHRGGFSPVDLPHRYAVRSEHQHHGFSGIGQAAGWAISASVTVARRFQPCGPPCRPLRPGHGVGSRVDEAIVFAPHGDRQLGSGSVSGHSGACGQEEECWPASFFQATPVETLFARKGTNLCDRLGPVSPSKVPSMKITLRRQIACYTDLAAILALVDPCPKGVLGPSFALPSGRTAQATQALRAFRLKSYGGNWVMTR